MKGKLYGVGVGPGDPELLTLKAINVIKKCDTIAIPKTDKAYKTALSIIDKYIEEKEWLECQFIMEKDILKRKAARQIAASNIAKLLDDGKDVAFITLGDPTTYSTYMYVHKIIVNMGFDTEIIPGVTSYTAAAAKLGIALCEDDEPLIIIPARHSEDIDELLSYQGNKVIMKSGENLASVLDKLKQQGYGDKTKIAYRVTFDDEKLYRSIKEYEQASEHGYFTIAIVKES